MPLLKTVAPEEATGVIKEAYAIFNPFGMVPTPFTMYSTSEALVDARQRVMRYTMAHPTLSPGLLALIRLIVAEQNNYYYCVSLNSMILKANGLGDEDSIAKVMADPQTAPLPEKDKALLLFVIKAVKTPEAVTAQDMDSLRALGWEDRDILEATAHGAGMVMDGILFKAFKMDEGEAC